MKFHTANRIRARLCISFLILSFAGLAREPEKTFAIVDGGVERSEDAPNVPADFRFLPGDYVYFTFYIAGFATKTNEETNVRTMSLEYEVTPEDANNVPLAESATGKIQDRLGTEDKNWIPKRRASFLLPSYVGAGIFKVHVEAKDSIGQTQASRDFPFLIGGVNVGNPASIQAEDFAFLRSEMEERPLDLPAYSPGDTVWARFDMVGFKHGQGNEYKLSYGISISRPDGKHFLEEKDAARIASESFYPAQFIPGELQIATPKNAEHGSYLLTLTVRDLIANQSFDLKRSFTIE